MEGLPFNLVEKKDLVPVRAPSANGSKSNNKSSKNNNNKNDGNIANGHNKNNNNIENKNNDENEEKKIDPKYLSPWERKHMDFGRWYKKKLKHDLKQLADMCCMVQDIIAIKVW